MSKKHQRTNSRVTLFTRGLAFLLISAASGLSIPAQSKTDRPSEPLVSVTVVATGLHNPRGLNFGPDGALYVAEAGADGVPGPCANLGNGVSCISDTGSILRFDPATGATERVITSLPSLIAANGTATAALGAHDISFQGFGIGFVTIGLGGNPILRTSAFGAAGSRLARLAKFNYGGRFGYYEDLGAYEVEANPDGHPVPDSNPYGLLALPGKVIYADAGGNALNQVRGNGTITTLAVFPDRVVNLADAPAVLVQSVPTTVAIGPEGDYYVGELTGDPFIVGAANVYRVSACGGDPVVAYTGFTNIIDIAFDSDGSLYVLEIARNGIPNFNPGRLVRITTNGTRSEIATGLLRAPGGIAIGRDGALYVTNRSTSSTLGELIRIQF